MAALGAPVLGIPPFENGHEPDVKLSRPFVHTKAELYVCP